MPAISSPNLTLLRSEHHRHELYASILAPRTLWTAQVNGVPDREATTIPFDGGSGDNWAWVEPWQTVLVGSAPGLANVGKVRIRTVTSADGGVTGTLEAGHNEVLWFDGAWLTFTHNYELWSVFPRLGPAPTFIFYKDNDIVYTDQNEQPTPAAIMGPHRAGFLASGTFTINLPTSLSYAIAPGATIVSTSVTVLPSAGVTVDAEVGGVTPVHFTLPGQYWAKTVATDSNGKTQTTLRSVFVHEDDATSSNYPFIDFRTVSLTGDWSSGGWMASIELNDNAALTSIPQGTLLVLWQRARYGDTQQDVSLLDFGSNTIIAGYVRKGQITRNRKAGGAFSIDVQTIEAVMRERYMFSISLAPAANPSVWYEYINGSLTAGRIAHHVLSEHSSLMRITDVLGLTNVTTQRKYADIDKGNLYEMVDNLVRDAGIRAHLVCDKTGRLILTQDIALLDDASRASRATISELTEKDARQVIEIMERQESETAFVFVSGFHYDGVDATPYGATSPGHWPAPKGGAQEVHVERQMLLSQDDVNELAGQIFAVKNNPYPEVRAEFTGNYLGVLEPAIQEWWEINLAGGDTIRGLVWTDKKMVLRNVQATMAIRGGFVSVSASFEPEANGIPGVPYYWPDLPTEDEGWPDEIGDPNIEIPDTGSGAGMILTASSLQVLPYSINTWDLRSANDIWDAGQDPFWRSKVGNNNPNNAIIYTAEDGQIRRSLNAGQTYTVLNPGNPPNGTFANCEVIQYEGNPFVEDEHIFLVREDLGAGAWRSWLLHYDEADWTWHQLGGGATEFDLIDADGSDITAASTRSWQLMGDNDRLLVSGIGDGGPYSVLFSIDTDTETVTQIDLVESPTCPAWGRLLRMSNTHAVFVYADQTQANRKGPLKARVVDISSDTISFGAEFTIDSTTSNLDYDIAWQSDVQAMVVYCTHADSILHAQPIGINDGTNTVFLGGTAATASRNCRNFAIHSIGEVFVPDTFRNEIFCTYRNPTGHSLNYFIVDDTLGSVSIGASTVLDSDAMRISPTASMDNVYIGWHGIAAIGADRDKMVRMYANVDNTERAIVVNLADTDNPVIGSPVGSSYTGVYRRCIYRAANKVAFSPTTSPDFDEDFATATIAGVNLEFDGNNYDHPLFIGAPVAYLGGGYYAFLGNGSAFIGIDTNTAAGLGLEVGTGDVKALGMDISKGTGAAVYVTSWAENNEIVLSSRQLPGFGILADWSMGAATLSQVDARTYWAHPFCPFGDDNYVVVYGRMNDAAGLGLTHVIGSQDAGASFLAMVNDWGDDHAGSMIENGFTELFIMRNIASRSAKVYVAFFLGGASLLGTVPYMGGVNPQARALDYFGNLILGCSVPGDMMVIIAPPPYDAWFDITGNHNTANGVNSVEVL